MMRQANVSRKAVVKVVMGDIVKHKGDIGYFGKGRAGEHIFTAILGVRGWHKTGWKVGSIKGLGYGKEYSSLHQRIIEYLNENYTIDKVESVAI